ncbi:hypothetical protein EC973_004331 [Apophysomyces ossiformis]|uniref:Protein kinase domain-containing protein n=1 Tax=Apophysomyces ossiformis TaxID=679940 RepID=A0A8H7ELT6_9FUNG|nr:hypothetical protein EC973_004331 [Apophysomyces ossiformis]
MSVFSQIKNFIRSGKSASGGDSLSTSSQRKAKKYEAVARIVEEENIAKQRLPTYDGLERYKLIAKLGDGAFSNVFKAINLENNEKVAVKVVRKYELNQQQKASVLKEVQIMRTLNHPSIVQLKNFIETKEYYFLVLELCEGGELFHQIVRLTYFSEDLARHCVRHVAEGIRYLHEEKGVVHRDIKPENLLFEPIPFMKRKTPLPPQQPYDEPKEDEGEFVEGLGGGGIGQVKLADFGLSKVVWDSHTMTPCGTVGYTAPEIVKDERYSKSVDMWALGCVLYTLLSGFPPFYDESIKDLTEKVAQGHYTFLSPWWDNISEEAKDLVSHLLCVDPEERYTIDQFLKHPWMLKKKSPDIDKENIPVDEISENVSDTSKERVLSEAEEFKKKVQENTTEPEQNTDETKTPTAERRRDIFSGITSMKECFDVSYAVHRMAEERARRKNLRRAQDGKDNRKPNQIFLNAINNRDSESEDDDENDTSLESDLTADETSSSSHSANDDEHDQGIETLRRNLDKTSLNHDKPNMMLQQLQRDRLAQRIKQRDSPTEHRQKSRKSKAVFELNMDNSTLLGRRKNQNKTDAPLVRASIDI